jgi:hypothetical protein
MTFGTRALLRCIVEKYWAATQGGYGYRISEESHMSDALLSAEV